MKRGRWRKIPWYLRYQVGARIASWMRKVAIKATHLHCTVEFQGPVRIGRGFELHIPDNGSFIVGPGVDFRRDFVCEIAGEGKVVIGAGTVFTSQTLIQCTTSIEIGRRCALGQSTLIADGNHAFRDHTKHMFEQGYDYRPIVIGDGAIVMTKCTVINSIGEKSVIGANSLVTRSIPAFCVAGGVPARVIEYFGPPESRPADVPADA